MEFAETSRNETVATFGNGLETWPCGHERTPENTQSVGDRNGVRCRTCRRETARKSYHNTKAGLSVEDRRLEGRLRYLPAQIINTRRKLAALENEARRYGFTELLEAR